MNEFTIFKSINTPIEENKIEKIVSNKYGSYYN